MFGYLKDISSFSNWQTQQYRLVFLFALFLISFIESGCSLTSSKQRYENPEFGISLDKPTSWRTEFDERNGSIVLEAEEGIWNKNSASVEIYGYACDLTNSTLLNIDKELLEADIKRLRILYDLDSVTILKEPTVIENKEYIIGITTIQIPTEVLAKDSPRNQVGQGIDIFQTIDVLAIKDRNNSAAVMAYIYKGLSEELNTEAQDIVDSIKFICLPQS